MHPQASDKRSGKFRSPPLPRPLFATKKKLTKYDVVCKEFFEALELCHANVWAKWTGGCNQAKRELNKCLHSDVRLLPPPPCQTTNQPLVLLVLPVSSPWHAQRGTGKMQN